MAVGLLSRAFNQRCQIFETGMLEYIENRFNFYVFKIPRPFLSRYFDRVYWVVISLYQLLKICSAQKD